MRGATCFLFKIFQTNRLLPLPCFPLRAGFACFITDCRLSFIFLVFAFHLSPCFPLRGKCLRKQTIEVNFNFFDFDTAFPLGRLFSPNYRLKVVSAAWCRRIATDEGHRFSHRSKCVQTTERSQFNYFPLRRALQKRSNFFQAAPLLFSADFSPREFVWRVLDRDAKRRACINQAPAKVPFEVFSDFLRPQTQ